MPPLFNPAWLIGAGVTALAHGAMRRPDIGFRPLGAALIGVGLALAATPALADQYKQAADSASIACTLSRNELTRIALIGDQFASVSKISSGTPFNDFAVTHEPVRGDIYLSVPDAYGPRAVSFFATTKKGYVYKFGCDLAPLPAQQIFITNPALAKNDAIAWETETPIETTAVRLIQAMAQQATVAGYEVRQSATPPQRVADLEVQLLAEYRGAGLTGKVVRLTNRANAPRALSTAEVAPKGALAVSLGQDSLAPRASTTGYVVIANGEAR
jgi:conjugal transfer pilus assembly protein TraK